MPAREDTRPMVANSALIHIQKAKHTTPQLGRKINLQPMHPWSSQTPVPLDQKQNLFVAQVAKSLK